MLYLVDALEQQGRWKDAVDALFQIAKLDGMVGPETNISIFDSLSGLDFVALEERVARRAAEKSPSVQ